VPQFFFKMMQLENKFSASSGWLTRLKEWYGIWEITILGEKLSGDQQAVNEFCGDFQVIVMKNSEVNL
jgi:hypothetical protein